MNIFDRSRSYFLKRKIRKKKAQGGEYQGTPKTTAIIQFFNKRCNISKIIPRIAEGFDEVIVIDDGSVDGSPYPLMKLLSRKNQFYIRSNDLYEVATYDRAIRFARGEIVCLLQDDDIPPDDDAWIANALQLFEKYTELHVLGGRNGVDILPRDSTDPPRVGGDNVDVQTVRFKGVNHYHVYRRPVYRDAALAVPFMFSVAVNRAPMFLRREAILALGGIDQSFRPFQCDDVDLCLRAWHAGGMVGLYDAPFRRDIGTGGMRLYNVGTMGAQAKKNWALIYDRYASSINDRKFANKVNALNERLLVSRPLVATSAR